MQTLIDTAAQAGNFTTLIGALQAGSLIDTLRTTGPYTLFAPTDAAFRRLVPGALLKRNSARPWPRPLGTPAAVQDAFPRIVWAREDRDRS